MGGAENGDHDFVYDLGTAGDVAEMDGVCRSGCCDASTYGTDDGQRLRTTDADNGKRTSWSGSWRADGVFAEKG